jgi:UDPglucose 6-dehydrogenase
MAKKICVVGTGYVGLLTAVGLSDFGNTVIGVDIDKSKIDLLNSGKSVIYEPGIEEYLVRNLESGRLQFSNDIASAIAESEVVFIAVGTPPKENGEADLSYLEDVVDRIGENMTAYKVIVVKSTVPVGTNRAVSDRLRARSAADFDVVSNPEFLREGKAVYDFFHPDRVVIGCADSRARSIMEDVYRSLYRINVPFVWCDWESAEIIKYASNGFLALKIGFINQVANLSEAVGADIQVIAKAMGMDSRIGSKFLHAGPGYGGSCFPKDTKALSSMARRNGVALTIVDAVIDSNEEQKRRAFERLRARLGSVDGKTIGVLGLAFKSETDDIRESPAISIVKLLLDSGAIIQAHDPKAMDNFSRVFSSVKYMKSEYDAAKGCDALVVLTEWNEYRSLDLVRLKSLMKNPYIFDMRNVVDQSEMDELGFGYDYIGRPGKSPSSA